MTFWQLLIHLFNFVLPALAMALFMPWAGRWVMGPRRKSLGRHMLWQALAGLGVLTVGLMVQGHDGTMATYTSLVVVAACIEWLLHKGWASR